MSHWTAYALNLQEWQSHLQNEWLLRRLLRQLSFIAGSKWEDSRSDDYTAHCPFHLSICTPATSWSSSQGHTISKHLDLYPRASLQSPRANEWLCGLFTTDMVDITVASVAVRPWYDDPPPTWAQPHIITTLAPLPWITPTSHQHGGSPPPTPLPGAIPLHEYHMVWPPPPPDAHAPVALPHTPGELWGYYDPISCFIDIVIGVIYSKWFIFDGGFDCLSISTLFRWSIDTSASCSDGSSTGTSCYRDIYTCSARS